MTRLAVLLATAGGAGYAPVAPGTAGSAVAVGVYLLVREWTFVPMLVLVSAVIVAGIWAGGVAARHFGAEDPGPVVVDEVAGQLIALWGTGPGLTGVVLGFFLFRAFDIVKPWPARQLEALPGGLGIMADDLAAGVYANLARILLVSGLAWLGW